MKSFVLAIALLFCATISFAAEQRFADTVGSVNVGNVIDGGVLTVPFITWGGDIPTFYANGGLDTKPGTIFDKQGLRIKLVNGDNFVQQVRDYVSGKTPFLRGTFGMIGMASEVIGSDPRTKGVVFLQLTWSAGDHCVARSEIKTITDLKGKKIVLQRGGPHVSFLDDILATANLKWDDIVVVWADDLSGTANSPAEMFRKDKSISACFVISPDMIGITGGLDKVPDKDAEGNVKGAHVLVSTAQLSYSIADVYMVRKDFYDAHPDLVAKFAAGYLKAVEEVLDLKKEYEGKGNARYKDLMQTSQNIFGKNAVPTLDDAHGMVCDATFVGHPGNVAFFTEKNNQHGFEVLQERVLTLAVGRGFAKVKQGFFASPIDWSSKTFVGYLSKTDVKKGERFRSEAVAEEIEKLNSGELDSRTIVSFTIGFEPNSTEFSAVQYGAEFQRVVDALGKFGNAVIAVRGHADPSKVLYEFVQAGMSKGILKREGTKGNYSYSLNGKALNVAATPELLKMIAEGEFDGVDEHNPREVMQAALNTSLQRAEAVRTAIIEYAKSKGLTIDKSQIQPQGVGVREPFIIHPTPEDAKKNMRVEFRLMRVNAEATNPSEFDY